MHEFIKGSVIDGICEMREKKEEGEREAAGTG